jgi:hypothetical protein
VGVGKGGDHPIVTTNLIAEVRLKELFRWVRDSDMAAV